MCAEVERSARTSRELPRNLAPARRRISLGLQRCVAVLRYEPSSVCVTNPPITDRTLLAARRASQLNGRLAPGVAWLAGPDFDDPTQADHREALEVCDLYLLRHARHRLVGGVFGVLFAAVVGVRWYGTVTVGIGSGNPLADLLFCGLAGVIVGALSAETFRLGSDRSEQRTASLTQRHVNAGKPRLVLAQSLALIAITCGLTAAATGHDVMALAIALIVAVPVVVAERVHVAIVTRPRPVMTDRALLLDMRLRSFAASSVSYLELAAAALMLGWTLSKIQGVPAVVTVGQFVVVVACLIVAVVSLRRAAPRQPRNVAHDLVLTGQSSRT